MKIIHQPPRPYAPTRAYMEAMTDWLASEGLRPEDIPSDAFLVLETSDGYVAVYREFLRDNGVKFLEPHAELAGVSRQRHYAKTDWQTRSVASTPPAYEGVL